MRYWRFLGLASIAAGLVAGSGLLTGAGALAASAEKGKIAFVKHGCWQCHGFEGQGSVATSNGKVLAPDPLPFETFSSFVRTTNGQMPPYREPVLSNEELADIHAFLSSIPKPADYKTIPLLNQ